MSSLIPDTILEIGILDGYSLNSFIKYRNKNCEITAIDLFEKYEYKNSNFEEIKNKFQKFERVNIEYGDFYNYYKKSSNFDLIHIDISNDANTYKFAIENYLTLANKALVLEGGSLERDNVEWMKKYNKPKINNYLHSIADTHPHKIYKDFPSLTIFYKDE
tara:strand:- start:1622 stop:2104 length:483 start_codon:yes stop_codon:yes gene_type:complete